MKRLVAVATILCAGLGSGCGLMRPDSDCEKPQEYESSQTVARLHVPAGFDAPDTRDALVVPDVAAPEAPRSKSSGCLDEPPRYRSDVAAQTDGQSAGQTGSTVAGAEEGGQRLFLPESSVRDLGWEYGLDFVFLKSADWSFEGGSSLSVNDDEALTFTFGYRFNSRLELQGALAWQNSSYTGTLVSGDVPAKPPINIKGDYEAWTPRFSVDYNFLDRSITPYVTAGLGWAFIDSNIPSGQVSVGCWWDPWYGEICSAYRDTRKFDTFTYQAGVGLRWDFSSRYSMRFGYEKHWFDFSKGTGAAALDEIRLGIIWRH